MPIRGFHEGFLSYFQRSGEILRVQAIKKLDETLSLGVLFPTEIYHFRAHDVMQCHPTYFLRGGELGFL